MDQGRNKILCIEDDRETAALIAEELIDRGFEVSTVHSGQEGLLAIMKATPDLILCDISMPTMTGFEVFERLKEFTPQLGRIPFVFSGAVPRIWLADDVRPQGLVRSNLRLFLLWRYKRDFVRCRWTSARATSPQLLH